MSNIYTLDIEVAPTHDIKTFEKGYEGPKYDGDDVNIYSVATFDVSMVEGSTRENQKGFIQHLSFDNFFRYFKHISDGRESYRFYVHNLGYEGQFLIPWLLRHGFKQTLGDRVGKNEWKILEKGQTIYRLTAMLGNVTFVFEDTLCKTNAKLEALAKEVGYDLAVKGHEDKEFDYTKVRLPEEELTKDELMYIYDDVASLAMIYCLLLKGSRLTIGSEAFADFIGNRFGHYEGRKTKKGEDIPYNWRLEDYKRLFPGKTVNPVMQPYYIGGYCDLIDADTSVRYDFPIHSFDVNSMYPWAMMGDMPCGCPIIKPWLVGMKVNDFIKRNKIVFFHIRFRIKQVKSVNYYAGKYARTLYDQHDDFLLPETLELFSRCYEFRQFAILETLEFPVYHNLFDNYVLKHYEDKKRSVGAKRLKAKLDLNNLYGKTAQRPERENKIYSFKEDGTLAYRTVPDIQPEERRTAYLPVALTIVQRARVKLLSAVLALRENGFKVFYCDTDSIKTTATPEQAYRCGLDIDEHKLGAWKDEGVGYKNVFVCPKKYLMVDQKGEIVAFGKSGINKVSDKDTLPTTFNLNKITIDNYKMGMSITVNRRKVVRGGILLVPTLYTLTF